MEQLTGQHQHTFDAIFRHPTSANIEWHALVALFRHLGEVTEEPNGKMKFARNGQTLTLHAQGKDAEAETIADIRRFLQMSEAPIGIPSEGGDCLLVLDHSEARVYRSLDPDTQPSHIEPYDPQGWDKHVHDPHEYARPRTAATHREFYDRIATALLGAGRVLVFGDGKGSSQEFSHLLDDLKLHHPDLAKRVIGTATIDLGHLTEREILAKARDLFANLVAQPA